MLDRNLGFPIRLGFDQTVGADAHDACRLGREPDLSREIAKLPAGILASDEQLLLGIATDKLEATVNKTAVFPRPSAPRSRGRPDPMPGFQLQPEWMQRLPRSRQSRM